MIILPLSSCVLAWLNNMSRNTLKSILAYRYCTTPWTRSSSLANNFKISELLNLHSDSHWSLLDNIYPHNCILTYAIDLGGSKFNVGQVNWNLSKDKVNSIDINGKNIIPSKRAQEWCKENKTFTKKWKTTIISMAFSTKLSI